MTSNGGSRVYRSARSYTAIEQSFRELDARESKVQSFYVPLAKGEKLPEGETRQRDRHRFAEYLDWSDQVSVLLEAQHLDAARRRPSSAANAAFGSSSVGAGKAAAAGSEAGMSARPWSSKAALASGCASKKPTGAQGQSWKASGTAVGGDAALNSIQDYTDIPEDDDPDGEDEDVVAELGAPATPRRRPSTAAGLRADRAQSAASRRSVSVRGTSEVRPASAAAPFRPPAGSPSWQRPASSSGGRPRSSSASSAGRTAARSSSPAAAGAGAAHRSGRFSASPSKGAAAVWPESAKHLAARRRALAASRGIAPCGHPRVWNQHVPGRPAAAAAAPQEASEPPAERLDAAPQDHALASELAKASRIHSAVQVEMVAAQIRADLQQDAAAMQRFERMHLGLGCVPPGSEALACRAAAFSTPPKRRRPGTAAARLPARADASRPRSAHPVLQSSTYAASRILSSPSLTALATAFSRVSSSPPAGAPGAFAFSGTLEMQQLIRHVSVAPTAASLEPCRAHQSKCLSLLEEARAALKETLAQYSRPAAPPLSLHPFRAAPAEMEEQAVGSSASAAPSSAHGARDPQMPPPADSQASVPKAAHRTVSWWLGGAASDRLSEAASGEGPAAEQPDPADLERSGRAPQHAYRRYLAAVEASLLETERAATLPGLPHGAAEGAGPRGAALVAAADGGDSAGAAAPFPEAAPALHKDGGKQPRYGDAQEPQHPAAALVQAAAPAGGARADEDCTAPDPEHAVAMQALPGSELRAFAERPARAAAAAITSQPGEQPAAQVRQDTGTAAASALPRSGVWPQDTQLSTRSRKEAGTASSVSPVQLCLPEAEGSLQLQDSFIVIPTMPSVETV